MRIALFHIITITLVIGLTSCSKEEHIDYSGIEVYGHGGAGFESYTNTLPANSYQSIEKAIEILNADGIEVDLQIDSNGNTWLYHDQFLDSKTNGIGCFGEKSTSYINACSYKLGGRLYSLQELINYFSTMTPKPKISLQVQFFNRCIDFNQLILSITKIMEINDAYDWIQIESDSPEILSILKGSSSRFKLFLNATNVNIGISECSANGFNGVIMDNDVVSKEDVQRVQFTGLKIGLYGIDNQGSINSALKKRPNQIQVDNIELTHRIMNQ